MKAFVRVLCLVGSLGLLTVLVAVPAFAGVRPSVTSLSTHRAVYWGGSRVTVHGHNFSRVEKVMFGASRGSGVHVVSPSTLTVYDPSHKYGTTHVRVVTTSGWSAKTSANKFTFTHPSMRSHIQGGLTGNQEKSISAKVRRAHHNVGTARRSRTWTQAMGNTAVARARSWLGIPYSWAGGNSRGPTAGVCAHNGGDLDCHIIGFDCSGLTLYSWAPYETLAHYAATQHSRAGRFHPSVGQLVPGDLVFFSGYISGGIGHTAIYEGNGNVIQAEESGTVVMRSKLTSVIASSGVYRGATRPLSTGKQAPGPKLTFRTAQLAATGGTLTLKGSYLSNATTVVVAGKTYYTFAKRTASELVVKAPAHKAGKVSVAVSNPWGTATTSTTFMAGPKLTSLTPTSGTTAGGNVVTAHGSNLASATRVTVGGVAATFHAVSSTALTITMPAHAATPTPVKVQVVTPFGTSAPLLYTYVAPSPATARKASGSSTSAPPSSSSPPPASGSSTSAPPSSSSPPPVGGSSTSAPPSSSSPPPGVPSTHASTTSAATRSAATASTAPHAP